MSPADIDRRKVLAHIHARRRGIFRYIRNLALLFVGALLVGAILGHLIPGDDPAWSPPNVPYTRIGEAP